MKEKVNWNLISSFYMKKNIFRTLFTWTVWTSRSPGSRSFSRRALRGFLTLKLSVGAFEDDDGEVATSDGDDPVDSEDVAGVAVKKFDFRLCRVGSMSDILPTLCWMLRILRCISSQTSEENIHIEKHMQWISWIWTILVWFSAQAHFKQWLSCFKKVLT